MHFYFCKAFKIITDFKRLLSRSVVMSHASLNKSSCNNDFKCEFSQILPESKQWNDVKFFKKKIIEKVFLSPWNFYVLLILATISPVLVRNEVERTTTADFFYPVNNGKITIREKFNAYMECNKKTITTKKSVSRYKERSKLDFYILNRHIFQILRI